MREESLSTLPHFAHSRSLSLRPIPIRAFLSVCKSIRFSAQDSAYQHDSCRCHSRADAWGLGLAPLESIFVKS